VSTFVPQHAFIVPHGWAEHNQAGDRPAARILGEIRARDHILRKELPANMAEKAEIVPLGHDKLPHVFVVELGSDAREVCDAAGVLSAATRAAMIIFIGLSYKHRNFAGA
jgi:hypothetical protein